VKRRDKENDEASHNSNFRTPEGVMSYVSDLRLQWRVRRPSTSIDGAGGIEEIAEGGTGTGTLVKMVRGPCNVSEDVED